MRTADNLPILTGKPTGNYLLFPFTEPSTEKLEKFSYAFTKKND